MRTIVVCLALGLVVPSAVFGTEQPSNFRVYGARSSEERQAIASRCQAIRDELHARWNGDAKQIAWTPPCEIVLHRDASAYLKVVGLGGRGTVGATYIQFDTRHTGRILRRRVDLLATNPMDLLAALPHEMTHVLLADRFAGKQPPAWLDEGTATLADSLTKQKRHLLDLRGAVSRGQGMSIAHLLAHEGPIPAGRRACFYGQSVALATILTRLDSPVRIFEFASELERTTPEKALRKVYNLEVSELDRRINDLALGSELAQQP